MRFGRSRSSKVVDFGTNRKGVCDFLLVINSNFGPILHRFWNTASYWLKIANFSDPTLVWRPRSGWTCQNFWMKLIPQKTRGMGQLYGENCIILTSTVFGWSTRVTDRRRDGQTDGRNCDSICALSIYAVARKNERRNAHILPRITHYNWATKSWEWSKPAIMSSNVTWHCIRYTPALSVSYQRI